MTKKWTEWGLSKPAYLPLMEIIRRRLFSMNAKQSYIGEISGINAQTISNTIQAKKPSLITVMMLANSVGYELMLRDVVSGEMVSVPGQSPRVPSFPEASSEPQNQPSRKKVS